MSGRSRRISRLVDSLVLPSPWLLRSFVDDLARQRQRQIRLVPIETHGSGLHGLWVATAEVDYIAYPARGSGFHRDVVILHEVGHMVLRHPSRSLSDLDDPCRHNPYSRRHEDDADSFAELLLRRAGAAVAPAAAEPDERRVIATFGTETTTSARISEHRRDPHPAIGAADRLHAS